MNVTLQDLFVSVNNNAEKDSSHSVNPNVMLCSPLTIWHGFGSSTSLIRNLFEDIESISKTTHIVIFKRFVGNRHNLRAHSPFVVNIIKGTTMFRIVMQLLTNV